MFLPLKLREHVRLVTVPGTERRAPAAGPVRAHALRVDRAAAPDAPPDWLRWYLAAGAAIGGAAWLLARHARASVARPASGFALLAGGWALVAGLAGLVMAGLWGLTDHVMACCNENLLQMNPLALLVLPGVVGWRGRGRAAKLAGRGGAGRGGSVGLGLVLQALPGLDQVNGPVIALALPAQVGIAAGLRRLVGRRRWQPESPA